MGECPFRLVRAEGAAIDLAVREVVRPDGAARLEPRAAAVLTALVEAEGQVVIREALLDRCWRDGEGSDEALTQAVAQIRRALGDDPRRPRFVGTVHRTGYRWLAREPVSPPPPATPVTTRRTPPWRWAAALSAVALLGAIAGAGAWKAAAAPGPRLQIETEAVVALDGETVRTVREYNGTREEVRAAMAANGETLR